MKFSLFNRIRPLYFFAAFAVGLLVCYIITPPPEVVVKFPSPFNSNQVLYHDKTDGCFMIGADKVPCPRDRSIIKPQPIAEAFRQKQGRA